MYVRDHTRPQLKAAMGLDPTAYDYEVFRITNEITKQVFPVSLDIDNPAFRAGMTRLFEAQTGINTAKAQGGPLGWLKQAYWAAVGGAAFVRLYLLPMKQHELPAQIRMQPVW
jgi:magnesium-protoporphyrin IX monomethyl ester (oxidative) cyclase